MREFVKANMSYWLAQSLFGVQQMINMFTPQGARQEHPLTAGFNNVARATVDTMGTAMGAAFRAGDNLQRGAVDLTFNLLTLGGSNRGGGGGRWQGAGGGGQWGGRGGGQWSGGGQRGQGWAGAASNLGQQTAGAFAQGMSAMGQTADVVGQAVGGGAAQFGGAPQGQWSGGGGRQGPSGGGGQQGGGWGPVPPPPQGNIR